MIDELKGKISKIENIKVQGAIMRSKSRWVSQGEHPTKYFFNLERRNAQSKAMNQILDTHNRLTRNPEKILQIQSQFYKNLY